MDVFSVHQALRVPQVCDILLNINIKDFFQDLQEKQVLQDLMDQMEFLETLKVPQVHQVLWERLENQEEMDFQEREGNQAEKGTDGFLLPKVKKVTQESVVREDPKDLQVIKVNPESQVFQEKQEFKAFQGKPDLQANPDLMEIS